MDTRNGSRIIQDRPEESREAARLVIDEYGEPAEATPSFLVWYQVGDWKRVIASTAFFNHGFPAPHIDSAAPVTGYQVPVEQLSALAAFDGSVIVERTAGEVSARCHDEEANRLALNLMNDLVTGWKDVDEARAYNAREIVRYRKKEPTPYMDKLHFEPGIKTAHPDVRVLSDEDLEKAAAGGGLKEQP
jgi:hypothetical protein